MTTKSATYKYSPAEEFLLKVLRQKGGKPINSKQLSAEYSRDKKNREMRKAREVKSGRKVYYGDIFINSSMRSLIIKVKANKEAFRIMRSENRPFEFWIE